MKGSSPPKSRSALAWRTGSTTTSSREADTPSLCWNSVEPSTATLGSTGARSSASSLLPSPPESCLLSCSSGINQGNIQLTLHICFFIFIFIFSVFLGPYLRHMEIPRLGVASELQLLSATATAMWDPSHGFDLHHSSRILNPLKARNQTHVLMDASRVHYCWTTTGTPILKSPK